MVLHSATAVHQTETHGAPARVSGTGEGMHRVCAMAKPSTSTAGARAAGQQPSDYHSPRLQHSAGLSGTQM